MGVKILVQVAGDNGLINLYQSVNDYLVKPTGKLAIGWSMGRQLYLGKDGKFLSARDNPEVMEDTLPELMREFSKSVISSGGIYDGYANAISFEAQAARAQAEAFSPFNAGSPIIIEEATFFIHGELLKTVRFFIDDRYWVVQNGYEGHLVMLNWEKLGVIGLPASPTPGTRVNVAGINGKEYTFVFHGENLHLNMILDCSDDSVVNTPFELPIDHPFLQYIQLGSAICHVGKNKE